MIAKKVKPHPSNRYGKLANYIAAANEKGEKLHSLWIEGCDAGTDIKDLDLAILEVEATQKLNSRAKATKTYHLMISFKEEDRIPNANELKDIEKEFAEALSFEDHQRIIGCHQNTHCFHMHVAYNKVHPETLRNHSPKWDHYKLAEVCKQVEMEYNLTPVHSKDQKLTKGKGNGKENSKAKDKEAHTWEESFETYVKNQKTDIQKDLKGSNNWQFFHKTMDQFDIRFKPRGAGLVIKNLNGKQQIKASSLGREFSKKALECKLGPYQAPAVSKDKSKATTKAPKKDSYKPRPITKHPKTQKYWNRYIGAKGSKQALTTEAFKTFREFLQVEALGDPLAMAIIHYQKKIIELALNPTKKILKR